VSLPLPVGPAIASAKTKQDFANFPRPFSTGRVTVLDGVLGAPAQPELPWAAGFGDAPDG